MANSSMSAPSTAARGAASPAGSAALPRPAILDGGPLLPAPRPETLGEQV